MAATAPFARVTTDRLIALKTQMGRVRSQFGPHVIDVLKMDHGFMGGQHWTFSVLDDNNEPTNAVYVRVGDASRAEKAWVVEYRTGATTMERLALGKTVELGDFGDLDAALSAALLLVVDNER